MYHHTSEQSPSNVANIAAGGEPYSIPMPQAERREQIATLLRHFEGASIQQLISITQSDATEVEASIRQLIDAGGDVTARTNSEGSMVFYLFD